MISRLSLIIYSRAPLASLKLLFSIPGGNMKLKIPKTLKLGKETWKIKFDPDLVERENAVGMCYRDKPLILLSPDQTTQELNATFLHELLHAMLVNQHYISRAKEEKIVELISQSLEEVMRRNNLVKRAKRKLP
jgi:hypothetical protein